MAQNQLWKQKRYGRNRHGATPICCPHLPHAEPELARFPGCRDSRSPHCRTCALVARQRIHHLNYYNSRLGARPQKMRRFQRRMLFVGCLASALIPTAYAVDPVATYTFDNTLAAVEPGVVALTAVDPLGKSGYQTVNVFGNSKVTYHFDGSASPPSSQGGLDFNTTGLISSNDYSVEMVFELTGGSGYRRILDSLDRQSDNGLYIDPSNNLVSYPQGGSSSPFTANTFFDVFVTVDSSNT